MIIPGHSPVWNDVFSLPIPDEARQPASIDLRLGNRVIRNPEEGGEIVPCPPLIFPGDFLLAETLERIRIPLEYAARVEGKSTLGRRGLIIHATAGWVDPGFEGVLTLEMANISRVPISLKPEMWIGQLSLYVLSEPALPYTGKYQHADGPEAAKGTP